MTATNTMFVQSSLSDLITYKDMKLKKGEFNEKLDLQYAW